MNTDAATGASAEPPIRPPRDIAADASPVVGRHDWSDLGVRMVSGLVLGVGGIGAALLGGPWLAALTGAAVVAMAYEWARMSEPQAQTPALMFTLVGGLGAVMFASWRELAWGMAWLSVCAALSAARRRSFPGVLETLFGTIYIGAPTGVFLWLRGQPEGLETVLTLFTAIWTADIFAYFGGKLIGGPKVASGLSPNKTWSGIIVGALAGAVAGYVLGQRFSATGSLTWVAVGAVLALTGLMGDLFESFLKRRFGVKDASRIIPGHGGVLDRIDGLMAATLLTGAVLSAWPDFAARLMGAGR